MTQPGTNIRSVAIIAHVDHGKTTLIDGLLRQSGAWQSNRPLETRAMDHDDLERERGITIRSKNTAIEYSDHRIFLVDTPGHADFGGEVERVLGMVDACLLLVDAVEGVMPQTRFVVEKALAQGLRPMLVVNKVDRPEQRAAEIPDEVFDLLVELGANDDQLDFPVVYASGKQGAASTDLEGERTDLRPLLDMLLTHTPAPTGDPEAPLQFQAVTLDYDEYVGRLVVGRVQRGVLRRGASVVRVGRSGKSETLRVTKLFGPRGLDRVELSEVRAGELALLAGVDVIDVGDTVCDPGTPEALPRIPIDPPTVQVQIAVNTSSFAGQEGRFLTSRQIRDRLEREAMVNVSIDLRDGTSPESFEVAGRGELQLAVLIETMRREGYEFSVSRPQIIPKDVDGKPCEPFEEVCVEVPEASAGIVMEKLAMRRARLLHMEPRQGRTRLEFVAPSRGLFGYRTEFLGDTRGEGVMYRRVRGYEPVAGALPRRSGGAIVVSEAGRSTAHALFSIQERAEMFIGAGVPVYEGQVVGEHSRGNDLNVNVCRAKKLTNVRSVNKDDAAILTPPREISIEWALVWIEDDELLEVTPKSLRLRKRILASNLRKRRS